MNFYDYEKSIKQLLKANIAEQLFNTNIHAKIKADEDLMLQKVLELDSGSIIDQEESSRIKASN